MNARATTTGTFPRIPYPSWGARFPTLLLSAVSALLLFMACPACVHAHAVVIESSPRDGARLSRPPGEIVLRFNARIEKSLARLTLATADGRNVPLPPPGTGDTGGDDRLLIHLPPLGPGTYLLRYKILSTDGHATPGILRFTVTGGP